MRSLNRTQVSCVYSGYISEIYIISPVSIQRIYSFNWIPEVCYQAVAAPKRLINFVAPMAGVKVKPREISNFSPAFPVFIG